MQQQQQHITDVAAKASRRGGLWGPVIIIIFADLDLDLDWYEGPGEDDRHPKARGLLAFGPTRGQGIKRAKSNLAPTRQPHLRV